MARANFEQIRQEATANGLITDEEAVQMFICLMTLISPTAPTSYSQPGDVSPNRSLSPIHAYAEMFVALSAGTSHEG